MNQTAQELKQRGAEASVVAVAAAREGLALCPHCEGLYEADKAVESTWRPDDVVCPECGCTHQCDLCLVLFALEEGVKPSELDDETMCEGCEKEHTAECYLCDERAWLETMEEVSLRGDYGRRRQVAHVCGCCAEHCTECEDLMDAALSVNFEVKDVSAYDTARCGDCCTGPEEDEDE